jgi:ABC-2 type transport system permease protein
MTAGSATAVAPVVVPAGGLGHELRAVRTVWQREMIRFTRDRARMLSSLAQPLLFLFVLGTGLSSLVRSGSGGLDFRTFLFPGVVATSVLFTAVFSGISLVWDREFGFLREMMVAPISSSAIILGKCLGGATVATLQSLLILALCGVVGVPYHPVMLLELLGLLFVMAFMITAMGIAMAARITQIQAAMPVVQLVITPLMFLSGSLFPLANLPPWLTVATRLNPLTYAVHPMRVVVFDHLEVPAAARAALDPGLTWGTWVVPVGLEVALVIGLGVVLVITAIARFARTD